MRALHISYFNAAVVCTGLLTASVVAVAAPPLVPTPCLAGNCGTSAQSFVQYGSAGAVLNGTTLNVTQSSAKAVLNWADFNIANGYTVNFLQPGATSAVLNNIWSANPSVIAGRLNANGQVYLYNQNGIVFDKGAQVNVAGLTASTLPFAPVTGALDPDALFESGILSQNSGGNIPAIFVGPQSSTGAVAGTISVNNGASLTAADGGRIMLLGSAVTNSGSISTPDGQTILGAAGKAVYLAASSSPDMRGLLIEVDDTGVTGTVINNGQISAPRGNITLAGMLVNQQGLLSATTSVDANGSIYLVAGDTSAGATFYNSSPTDPNNDPTAFGGLLPNNGGTLLLTPGSVTQVLPDATDTGTLTVAQQGNFTPSQVQLAGRVIALEGSASIQAPAGEVNAYASANPYLLVSNKTDRLADTGNIYLDSSSSIDVSGLTNVQVPVTQNLLQVTLETNDLQNDPLLRNGFLHGQTVTVDVTDPPKLFDVTPYADNIGSNIEQLSTKGGTVNLIATGELIARAGSTLNVSGGAIAYQGGIGPSTTNLLGANGQVYNIASAPSTIQYVGVANNYAYTDPAWGITAKGSGQSYYNGYIQGSAAGTLNVESPQVYLRGTMLAATTDGPFQRTTAALTPGGTFELGCSSCKNPTTGLIDYGVEGGVTFTNSIPDNLVGDVVLDGYVVSSLNLPAISTLSPSQLTQSGFTSIDVASSGPVLLPAGVNLSLQANGGFTVNSASSIDIEGNLRVPGGQVVLQTASTGDNLAHSITLGTGSVIDVSGNWTNDSPSVTLQPGTAPIILNGGNITMSAAGDVVVGFDSRIDVSGGGWINQSNQLSAGTAGTLSVAASFSTSPGFAAEQPYSGTVSIEAGAELIGAGLKSGGGGTLSLQSGSITIGNTAGTAGELLLAPDFFSQGGFAQYNLTAQNDVIIGNLKDSLDATPVDIAPLEQTRVFTQNPFLQPTGAALTSFTQLQTLPDAQRAPASISFTATASDKSGADTGDVTLAQDASIATDPGAKVVLAANGYNGSVHVLGSIYAPAGTITLQLENPNNPLQSGVDPGFIANQQIELGPDATLAAPAYAQINTLNPLGYPEGSVLPGGTITLQANKGFVVTAPGSVINVNGAAALIDLVGPNGVTPTAVAADAGAISIGAREGIVLQGSLEGEAATFNGARVNGAEAGTLNVALGPTYSDSGGTGTGAQDPGGPETTGIFYPTATRTLTLSGQPQSQLFGIQQSGTAIISVGAIEAGGFDNVALTSADTIAFSGTVALQAGASLTLDAPLFVGNAGAQVSLKAPYVALGNFLNNPDYFDTEDPSPNAAAVLNPVLGSAALAVNAQLLDIRGVSGWSGFAAENLVSSGDIRVTPGENPINAPPAVNVPGSPIFEGALNTSATLDLQAAQLYPTTATAFAINDLPSGGAPSSPPAATTVAISSSLAAGSMPATPYSAGGSLTITATDINQYGVVRAPLGQIVLNGVSIDGAQGNVVTPGSVVLADGSLTSVSADGLIIPYGSTANVTQWTYSPAPGYTNIVTQPPAKQISLQGPEVTVNSGAKVDLSGGGDLYAYEFIAGQGGSVDVLDQGSVANPTRAAGTTVYSYAILPSLGSDFAPLDAQYLQSSTVGPNQTITLSGVPGLPSGTYALLPAHDALLPGAYAVQVVEQNSNLAQGSAIPQPNGGYEVAARFGVAGTNILSSLTSTVLVASDATVATQSQYTDSYANTFFSAAAAAAATAAPRLPADAGQLLVAATNSLTLNGSVNLAAGSFTSGTSSSGAPILQQGQGGDVAITAQNIVVVDAAASQTPAAGTLQVNVQQLDNLDAQTLILGASSTSTPTGEQLAVSGTQTVDLKNTVPLTAPQIILAAQDSVTVNPGAQIVATGASSANSPSTQGSNMLLLPGGGALLRVSSGPALALSVDPTTLPPNPTGVVSIGAGAIAQGSGSLLLYGTNNTTLAPGAQIFAPAVGLYSSAVSLGDVPTGTPGLALDAQLLGSLKGLTDLTIGSSSTINFYGAVQFGTPGSNSPTLNSISLDAAGLAGYGAGDKVLQAGNITLTNSSGAAASFVSPPDGSGALQLIATANAAPGSGQITLGGGAKTISGFSALDLQAGGDIVGQGTGTLTVASSQAVPVNLTSAALIGAAGSSQAISTSGAVTIAGATTGSNPSLPAAGLGAELTIQGSMIVQNGSIDLPGGILGLTATGGDVTLGNGSLTAAPGAVQGYTVTSAVAAGGQINLAAQAGSVVIDGGATVDVSGASSGTLGGDAGTLSVAAPLGTFTFAGSTLKGSAPSGAAQGSFNLDVGSGLGGSGLTALTTTLNSSGFTGIIDLRTRNDGAVTIADTVQASSFELAADQGTIDVAATGVINTSGGTAHDTNGGSIALWAGDGLTVAAGAHLLANAGSAGPVGSNGVTLAAHGGDITLGTSSGSIAINGGTAQQPTMISLQGSGTADTDGTLTLRASRTGDDAGVQIQIQNASSLDLVTRSPLIVEGFKVYSGTALGSTDPGAICPGCYDIADMNGLLFTQAQTFVANTATIIANDLGGLSNVQLRPGIELDGTGDLSVGGAATTVWDLASWNAALGAPVNVTLRATGNLIFNASLSDGFTDNGKAVANWTFGEPGTATASASYTLTAGADLTAANPLAVLTRPAPVLNLDNAANIGNAPPNSGNVILAPGNLIRTGTGDIQIAAGGDVLLGYEAGNAAGNLYVNGTLQVTESDPLTSAIYTAGTPAMLTAAQAAEFSAPTLTAALTNKGGQVSYPTDGGDINISAADDIRSAPSAQLISDWLWRFAPPGGTAGAGANTTWWVMFNDFQQGIGALGGGDLSVSAGRDIVNLGAVIPTTGQLLVGPNGVPSASDLLLTGGGNLQVRAGSDIVSGLFEDDWGNAAISAGGALTSSADSTFGQETAGLNITSLTAGTGGASLPSAEIFPILAVGNGVFDIDARSNIALDAVTNSTTLPLTAANHSLVSKAGGDGAFYPYAITSNPSTLNLVSTGGNVILNNDALSNLPIVALSAANIDYEKVPEGNDQTYLAVYPTTLNVASLTGDIDLGNSASPQAASNGVDITVFPASLGTLNLLAAGSINNDGSPLGFAITVSEANPALVPNLLAPQTVLNFPGVSGAPLAQQPLHQDDPQPIMLVANSGDIGAGTLTFPKAADVIAGANITDLTLNGKNLNPADVTLFAAGGNISYSTPTEPVTNALLPNLNGINLAGPGYLEVLAGASINLGDANGILTTGSLSDPRLSSTGASLIAGAGFGTNVVGGLRQPDDQAFINAYLAPASGTGAEGAYAGTLVNYMQQLYPTDGTPSYASALTSFEALTPAQQLPLLSQVLSDELSATGLAHTQQGTSYARGYAAINTLFPATDANGKALTYSGDLNMFFSQLKTEQGGDIDLLAPGGSVVVGVANPPATLATVKQIYNATGPPTPAAVNLGILVLGQGAVQGFADQDFTVNQSRILTLEGGNIILWASNGDIDAGKGAKSASGAPPPVIQTDANGNLYVDPSNAVSGSGIGQLLTVPGIKAGLVNLIAPKGAVNAGDAGIRVAGNLNIAAVEVIGAGNITVAGTATGVPVSQAGAFAGALSGANSLGDASKNVVDQLSQDLGTSASYDQMNDTLLPTFINVKLFCLGVECETN